MKIFSCLLFALFLSTATMGQSSYRELAGYLDYANKREASQVAASSGSPLLQNLLFWSDVSEQTYSGATSKLVDSAPSPITELNGINLTSSVYTDDAGWLSLGANVSTGDAWTATDANALKLRLDDSDFTIATWIKTPTTGWFASNLDIVGKRSSDGAGPGWKLHTQTTAGTIRLRIEDDGNVAIGLDLDGLPTTGNTPMFIVATHTDDTYYMADLVSGNDTTFTSPTYVGFNLRDDGTFHVGQGNTNYFNNKIGDVLIYDMAKSTDDLAAIYDDTKADHGISAYATQPSSIDSLIVWLKSDIAVTTSSGNVTTWGDQSGNGNNATSGGAPPAYNTTQLNGFPDLDFVKASSEYLQIADDASLTSFDGYSIFIVAKLDDLSALSTILRNKPLGAVQSTSGIAIELVTDSINVGSSALADNSTSRGYNFGGGTFGTTNAHIISVVAANNVSNSRIFVDGAETGVSNTVNLGPLTSAIDGIKMNIGAEPSSNGRNLDFHLYELLVYKKTLSTQEISSVHAYLLDRYGF